DRRLERRQVEVAQPLLGHVGRVVVTPALRLAVGSEVFRAGDLLVRRAVVGPLRPLDPRGHGRAEVRILAGTLPDPAQRGSCETSTIGAYVWLSPTAADWRARIVASSVATCGSKLLAAPSGIGKIVRKPWIVSNANSSGMCSRDWSTAMCWSRLICTGSVTLRIEP